MHDILSQETEIIPLIALLDEWDTEDATDNPIELAKREQEWEQFKENMNANRRATGERLLFLCSDNNCLS